MLKEKIEVKKNVRAIEGLVKGEKIYFDEYATEDNEISVSDNLMSVLSSKDDITKYVKNVQVKRDTGLYPYMKTQGAELTSTAELEANPVVPEVSIVNLEYVIETYRGEIPIAEEILEDAENVGIDIGMVLAEHSKQIDVNTKNTEIITLLKAAAPEAVTGKAGLISLINSYSTAYNVKMFVSASLFELLDNDDLIDYTKDFPRFKDKEVVRLDDDKIGAAAGDLVGFVGDPYEYIHLFDRKLVGLKYVNNKIFGRPLAVSTRFDCKVANTEAGSYITYTAS